MELIIQYDENDQVMTVFVRGEVDVSNVGEFKKEMEENILEYQPNIVLNCEDLAYIDSTGLGVLVSALKKAQGYGKSIKIVSLKPHLNKIFELTGLDGIFEIEVAKS
ncbi:MAG: STAS domain-containing protein [Christensenellaceae bacterium]